jgi:hypothetical protein
MSASARASTGLIAVGMLVACVGPAAAPRVSGRPAAPPVGSDGAGHVLAGRVRDDRTDAPVPSALVALLTDTLPGTQPLRTGATDAQGLYRLAGAPAGRYFVRVRRIGYFAETRPVQLGHCGVIVASGAHVGYCVDTRHIYVTSAARL